ncbi:hypothetical protein [Sporomusa termitida]|uniref:Uncharacterized protein n=1 Tax=Sporomusa termitida TaxID=2377 RepID=A0A517E019_9FIRM|nr:hypothetical protein [Sporomusa termitida]QDR82954.1 hypothetical protein SPTER_44030 [Sporomusa termitida]
MKNKTITRCSDNIPAITWELRRDFGFICKKHLQAMSAAQAILRGVDTYDMTIYDSLNCGKLTRLLKYLKQASC